MRGLGGGEGSMKCGTGAASGGSRRRTYWQKKKVQNTP